MFWTKLKYIHNNPVKAGLVEKPIDYKYSSAINYVEKDHSIIFVDTSWGGVDINQFFVEEQSLTLYQKTEHSTANVQ